MLFKSVFPYRDWLCNSGYFAFVTIGADYVGTIKNPFS